MFESSDPFLFFDYFRVPYGVTSAEHRTPDFATRMPFVGFASLRRRGGAGLGRTLYWPRLAADLAVPDLLAPAEFEFDGIRAYGHLVSHSQVEERVAATGTGWRPTSAVRNSHGQLVASLWRDHHGNVLLPFDPGEVMTGYWSERYRNSGRGRVRTHAERLGRRTYYQLRPVLPRAAQIGMRRRFAPLQARLPFPRWPVEPALHDFYAGVFRLLVDVAEAPVPWISPWPHGRSWAFVLTHDVETRAGYERISLLRDLEVGLGYRSSWNFVPKRYEVEALVIEKLVGDGFEIGVHGLYHDGRDLGSQAMLDLRLPAIREHADRWKAVGFRSPATHRVWEWMPRLGFDYDSSYPDTDPFGPQPGGCCSWLPFFNENLVELPITLPQDHTLFEILGGADERIWIDKIERLKRVQGMALLITHPDYTFDGRSPTAYRKLLEAYQGDKTTWCALPREVSAWWRRRANSQIKASSRGWRVVGPAAGDAAISFEKSA
jgi:hypothetical protein